VDTGELLWIAIGLTVGSVFGLLSYRETRMARKRIDTEGPQATAEVAETWVRNQLRIRYAAIAAAVGIMLVLVLTLARGTAELTRGMTGLGIMIVATTCFGLAFYRLGRWQYRRRARRLFGDGIVPPNAAMAPPPLDDQPVTDALPRRTSAST